MENGDLTDEQKKFMEECEDEFKDRYTEKDTDFMKIKSIGLKAPPICDYWHSRNNRKRTYDNREKRHFN